MRHDMNTVNTLWTVLVSDFNGTEQKNEEYEDIIERKPTG